MEKLVKLVGSHKYRHLFTTLPAGLFGVALMYVLFSPPKNNLTTAYQTYQSALVKYADANNDGFISAKERETFDFNLFSGRNLFYVPGEIARHYDGREVSREELLQWVEEKYGK